MIKKNSKRISNRKKQLSKKRPFKIAFKKKILNSQFTTNNRYHTIRIFKQTIAAQRAFIEQLSLSETTNSAKQDILTLRRTLKEINKSPLQETLDTIRSIANKYPYIVSSNKTQEDLRSFLYRDSENCTLDITKYTSTYSHGEILCALISIINYPLVRFTPYLMRQFKNEFDRDCYFFWMRAEYDESIKNNFFRLQQQFNIKLNKVDMQVLRNLFYQNYSTNEKKFQRFISNTNFFTITNNSVIILRECQVFANFGISPDATPTQDIRQLPQQRDLCFPYIRVLAESPYAVKQFETDTNNLPTIAYSKIDGEDVIIIHGRSQVIIAQQSFYSLHTVNHVLKPHPKAYPRLKPLSSYYACREDALQSRQTWSDAINGGVCIYDHNNQFVVCQRVSNYYGRTASVLTKPIVTSSCSHNVKVDVNCILNSDKPGLLDNQLIITSNEDERLRLRKEYQAKTRRLQFVEQEIKIDSHNTINEFENEKIRKAQLKVNKAKDAFFNHHGFLYFADDLSHYTPYHDRFVQRITDAELNLQNIRTAEYEKWNKAKNNKAKAKKEFHEFRDKHNKLKNFDYLPPIEKALYISIKCKIEKTSSKIYLVSTLNNQYQKLSFPIPEFPFFLSQIKKQLYSGNKQFTVKTNSQTVSLDASNFKSFKKV